MGSQSSEVLRKIRSEAGLSQRALGELAGTSGATIAAYESGTKEPRLSTLERIADRVDLAVDVTIRPRDRGAQLRARRERRSRAVAAAMAVAVERDAARAFRLGRENLDRSAAVVGENDAAAWIDEWRSLLDRGPAAVRTALLDPSERGHDLRQMAPFAGLLTEAELELALAVADVVDLGGRR